MMLRPVIVERDGKQTPLMCLHWKNWPPMAAVLGRAPETLRASKEIDEAEYQRIKVWERVCALTTMDPTKCLTCPHVRRVEYRQDVPFLISLDGRQVTKARESEVHEEMNPHRANARLSGRSGYGGQ